MERQYTLIICFHWIIINIWQYTLISTPAYCHRNVNNTLPASFYILSKLSGQQKDIIHHLLLLHVFSESICILDHVIWSPHQHTVTGMSKHPSSILICLSEAIRSMKHTILMVEVIINVKQCYIIVKMALSHWKTHNSICSTKQIFPRQWYYSFQYYPVICKWKDNILLVHVPDGSLYIFDSSIWPLYQYQGTGKLVATYWSSILLFQYLSSRFKMQGQYSIFTYMCCINVHIRISDNKISVLYSEGH